jgi:hypothetical protein
MVCIWLVLPIFALSATEEPPNHRRPAGDAELRYWLENMVWHHRFTAEEITAATGLNAAEAAAALKKFDIRPETRPKRPADAPLLVLPYPGGRHPRIGFLEGAIRPQRETKVSVFAPWDDSSYAVVDVPEAIWSNLGLTYLAHTHVPTLWTKQNIELPKLEWNRRADRTLDIERTLPNGIVYTAKIIPDKAGVRMELSLTNGTREKLTDLRVQNCVLLARMAGFEQQSNDNKVFSGAYAACKSADGKRWVITAWEPLHRTWANPKCPCIHSDPKFPDCEPGQTQRLTGWLSFYEGTDIDKEFKRLDQVRKQANPQAQQRTGTLRGTIIDADTGKPIAARVYVQGEDGRWWHVKSDDPAGTAVPYRKERADTKSFEVHTTVSAHPFRAELPPGKYTIIVERGKEYHPMVPQVAIGKDPVAVNMKLSRWIDMAKLGWYSGDTHVHRTLEELPNVMLAEDLNVALPLLHWVTDADTSPLKNPRSKELDPGRLIEVDRTHVIWPRNTEYEIFRVGKKPHTLGAFFVLNHKTLFDIGVPPVGPIAGKAQQEGALIELDKHNWPWSMMLIPIMRVALFELTNNHIWRTEFAFRSWGESPAEYMEVERDGQGQFTERGWIDFGFKNYYALLNSGFRLRPTAGTASGVHPVPLGFGRVYVHLSEGFSYDGWMKGLDAGRTFVTTGPMLLVQTNDRHPGHTFQQDRASQEYRIKGLAVSAVPLDRIEILVNGEVVRKIKPENRENGDGRHSPIDEKLTIDRTSWIAVRCFEEHPGGRVRFAHTAPVWIDVPGKPLLPRKAEIAYLVRRVEEQLTRNEKVLSKEAVAEYREALRVYRQIAEAAAKRR